MSFASDKDRKAVAAALKAGLHRRRRRGHRGCPSSAREHFPSDDAAAKLIYLALNATSTEWKRAVLEWHAVKS